MKRLLALLLVLTLVFSMVACKKDDSESTTDPTETTAPAGPPREGVYSRESYSVSDEVAKAATREIVAKMGDATLSNGALQVYYWMQVYTFLQCAADNSRVCLIVTCKALCHTGSQSVYVPRNKLHSSSYSDSSAGEASKAL